MVLNKLIRKLDYLKWEYKNDINTRRLVWYGVIGCIFIIVMTILHCIAIYKTSPEYTVFTIRILFK